MRRPEKSRSVAGILSACFMASMASVGVAENAPTKIQKQSFSVSYGAEMPEAAAELVAARVDAGIQYVSGYLEQSTHYRRPQEAAFIEVIIHPDKGPYQLRNSIFVPQERVLNLHAERAGARTDLNLVHEITHVLAESAGRKNRDRFYDDGLAVYLQHRFGGEASYPNFGQDLYIAFARAAADHGTTIPLAQSEAVRNGRETASGRKLAYIQEGAFTQFLIERHGLDDYLRLFNGEDYETVLGTSMASVEADWRALMQRFQATHR